MKTYVFTNENRSARSELLVDNLDGNCTIYEVRNTNTNNSALANNLHHLGVPTTRTPTDTGALKTIATNGGLRLEKVSSAGTTELVAAGTALDITTSSPLTNAVINVEYEATLEAEGGNVFAPVPAYHWSLVSGTLPTGLSLSESGAITGTPTVAGASTFTVRVTDYLGSYVEKEFSLTVISPTTTTTTTAP